MSRTRLAATLAACTMTLALTGCGGGSDSKAEPSPSTGSKGSEGSTSVKPSSGDTISGKGFTFRAPEGWKKNDGAQLPSIEFLALAVDPSDDDGFADNVNVIEDPTVVGVDDLGKLEDGLTSVLQNVATDVSIGDRIEVDGEKTAVVMAAYPKYRTVQHVMSHADTGYVVTYSFSLDLPKDEQLALASSVANSWKWAS